MLARVLEIGSDPADEPDLRIRKRTAVATVFVFMAVAVAIGVTDIALARLVPAALAFIQILAFTTSLLMFRRTRRLGPLVAAMAAIGMAILFLGLIPAGGFAQSSGDLVWILLVPLGAVLFLGGHAAAPAFGSVVVMVLAAVALDPYMRGAPQPSEEVKLVLSAIDRRVPSAVALGLVVFIDGERVRAKAESDALLLNVLPRSIAERLKQGERVIADHYDEVTVLFADVVEFTPFAARETPARVVDVLNEIFSRFDTLETSRSRESERCAPTCSTRVPSRRATIPTDHRHAASAENPMSEGEGTSRPLLPVAANLVGCNLTSRCSAPADREY